MATGTAISPGGDWSSSASWVAGFIPGNDDDAVMAHPIAVTDARIIGTSGAAGTNAIQINAGGSLTIQDTGSLTVRGDVALNGGPLNCNGNGQFWWDSSLAASPSTTAYAIKWLANNTNARITVRGTSFAAPFRFNSVLTNGAAAGRILGNSLNAMRIDMVNADLQNMGNGMTALAITNSGVNGNLFILDGVRFRSTVGGVLFLGGANNPDTYVNNVQWESAHRFEIGLGSGARAASRRTLQNSGFVGPVWFAGSMLTLRNITMSQPWVVNAPTTTNCEVLENIYIQRGGNGGGGTNMPDLFTDGGTATGLFFFHRDAASTNPHFVRCPEGNSARTVNVRRWMFQSASASAFSGDVLWPQSVQSGRTTVVKQCVWLPNFAGGSSGAAINYNSHGVAKLVFDHNTVAVGDGGITAGIYAGDNSNTLAADWLDSMRSNIFWRNGPGNAAVLFRQRTDNVNVVADGADVGFNTKWNFTGSAPAARAEGVGYIADADVPLFTGTLSALTTDDTLDPQFTDPTHDIRTYAREVGGYTGTDLEVCAALVDAFLAGNNTAHPNYNAAVSIDGLLTHVEQGFTPNNVAVQTAHDSEVGGWRGAVEGVSGGLSAGARRQYRTNILRMVA